VLTDEGLVVALPLGHPLLSDERPVELATVARGTLIVYPREPRPSYADLVLSLFRDHGVEPTEVQEVRELQTAIGLVAAKAGICIVPTSVQQLRRSDIIYRPLAQPATSPIILSRRVGDLSPELETIISVSLKVYRS
jgi:DNA-binding transcriptional LysR family regulator